MHETPSTARIVSLAGALVAELAKDPDALAELRALLTAEPAQETLTAPEVAERLRTTPRSVNRWAAEGRLHATRVGRAWRFDPARLAVAPVSHDPGPAPTSTPRRAARAPRVPQGTTTLSAIRG